MRKTLAALGTISSLLVCAQANATTVLPTTSMFQVLATGPNNFAPPPPSRLRSLDFPARMSRRLTVVLLRPAHRALSRQRSPRSAVTVLFEMDRFANVAAPPFFGDTPGHADTTNYLSGSGTETI